MGVKMIEKSPILQKMLIYVGYHSSRNLDPIFPVVLKIQAFEVRSFLFYLIECPFLAILTLKACIFRSTENFGPKSFEEWYPTYLSRIWSWNELWQHINICQANLNIAHLLHKQGLVETQLLRTVSKSLGTLDFSSTSNFDRSQFWSPLSYGDKK